MMMRGSSGRLWQFVLGGVVAALLTPVIVIQPAWAETPAAANQHRLADYDAALVRNPDDRAALIARARLRTRTGDINGAIADYGRAVALQADATLYRQRAALLSLRTDYRMAITDLDQAIRLDPHDGTAPLLRAQAREALGDKPKALADYRLALARDPRNADAQAAASRLAATGIVPPQQAPEQSDITGSVPPAITQPTKPDVVPPMVDDPATSASAAERMQQDLPPQDPPLRIVRGGVTSDATTESQTAPGIYHLPEQTVPPVESALPQQTPRQEAFNHREFKPHQEFKQKKRVKRSLRREARNRAPGFYDAFGGAGWR